jgi:5-methylthioadenosine/S-adenosylhomocysteine deaminase
MMILVRGVSYLVRDADRVERDVDVLIDGARIVRIGSVDARRLAPGATVLDGQGRALVPGFVNAHTHLYQSMLKGRRDDLSLVDWCDAVTFPFVRRVLDDAWHHGRQEVGRLWSMVATIEMVRSGITTFLDMDMNLDGVIAAWLEVGIRGVAAMTLVDQWVPEDVMVSLDETKDDTVRLIETWHQVPRESPLVTVFLGPSAPFTCSEGLLRWIRDRADEHDLGIQTHVSETAWEVEQSVSLTGRTPLDYLESIGFLTSPIAAAHGVHLTEGEIELAARRGVAVIYNPKSNMKLGSGIAPIGALRRAGVSIALGTDGAASNDLLDLFEEMRCAAMLQKVAAQDPTVLGARDVFRFATEGGAKACRLDSGTIDEGRLADVVLIDLGGAHLFRLTDEIVPALVYCARADDVETVVINGRVVMKDRTIATIDERAVLAEAKRVGERYA